MDNNNFSISQKDKINEKSSSNKSLIDVDKAISEIKKIARQIQTPSDLLDLTWEQLIPKIVKEKTDEFFQNAQKTIDYFFRHLI
ncbi:hypothetical protein [Candidatus Harpocratesius sp.]